MTSTDDAPERITRREAIRRVSALFGGVALVGQSAMLAGCVGQRPKDSLFSDDDIALLNEVAETILPETDTPGARAAGVGPFMALMVTDTYDADQQRVFVEGLSALDRESLEMHGTPFMSATPAQRLALLRKLDAEQVRYMRTRKHEAPAHYFRMMKELTLLGYFTSEIGYTKAMRYIETPGRYDPCVPWTPGERAWAPHA